ncbi:carboxypeptidase-like regulatory domain-containing protein [Flavobacterium sp.]|jgi:hypothetical protein|uniref:carboxypeptidase-like regulatory domain-containing protein n=1 Tax=Flavobacterium sp. TaxID=239 RepID=UPI0037BF1CBE
MKVLFLLIFIVSNFWINQEKIKFTILYKKNDPCPGANIFVKNTEFGTTSDLQGNAELILPNANQTIVVSMIGPTYSFKLIKSIDSVSVNFKRKSVIYFYKGKKVKKAKLNLDGM